jgi:hypothetical protein
MEAVRTFETSVNFNVTKRRYISEDSKTSYNASLRNFRYSAITYSHVILSILY